MDGVSTRQNSEWDIFADLPGDPMMWVLILSELAVFGILLGAFVVASVFNTPTFTAGHSLLNPALAGFNTVVLMTSGWAAARGTLAARFNRVKTCRLWLWLAITLGIAFVVAKLVEYAGEIAAGAVFDDNIFFTLYFLLTGFHLLHVVLGVIILIVVQRAARPTAVETGASFWHMVDLVWVLMFPIIYLTR